MLLKLSVLVTTVIFCSYSVLAGNDCTSGSPTPTDATVAQSQLVFANKLFQTLSTAYPGKNLVVSPFSMRVALSMVLKGSAGETENELSQALLGISADDQAAVTSSTDLFSKIVKSLLNVREYEIDSNGTNVTSLQVQMANGGFPSKEFHLLCPFIENIRDLFNGTFKTLDWKHNPDGAVDIVNQYVSKNTHGLIPSLLSQPGDPYTVLVLVNALYLKAAWSEPFNTAGTYQGTFHAQHGDIQVPFMYSIRTVPYFSSQEYELTAITLSYANDGFSMVCILPDEGKDLTQFVDEFTPEWLQSIVSNSSQQLVEMRVPSLKDFKYKNDYAEMLQKEFNMNTLFKNANFSKMAHLQPLERYFVSGVIQECDLKMNEAGTEAAAATAVVIDAIPVALPAEPPPSIPFSLSRPYFLYLIQQDQNGNINILFIAQVAEPM